MKHVSTRCAAKNPTTSSGRTPYTRLAKRVLRLLPAGRGHWISDVNENVSQEQRARLKRHSSKAVCSVKKKSAVLGSPVAKRASQRRWSGERPRGVHARSREIDSREGAVGPWARGAC